MHTRSDQQVVITGAANGLGRALALECHRLGYRLALIDSDYDDLDRLRRQLKDTSGRIMVCHADVASERDIAVARRSILDNYSRINMLINNAAISISQPLRTLTTQTSGACST